MSELTRLLLRALAYPAGADADVADPAELRTLVNWLENTKIRSRKVEDRESLLSEGDAFREALAAYLAELGAPSRVVAAAESEAGAVGTGVRAASVESGLEASTSGREGNTAVANWLLSHAAGLQYADDAEGLGERVQTARASAPDPAAWSLEALGPYPDIEDVRVAREIREAMRSLGFGDGDGGADGASPPAPPSPDDLRAFAAALSSYLLPSAAAPSGTGRASLDALPLGFSTGSADLDAAAKVFRLLLASDLTSLRSEIDAQLVAVQNITADPRTDTRRRRKQAT